MFEITFVLDEEYMNILDRMIAGTNMSRADYVAQFLKETMDAMIAATIVQPPRSELFDFIQSRPSKLG